MMSTIAESKYLEFCTIQESSSLATGYVGVGHTYQDVIIIIIIIIIIMQFLYINVLSQQPDGQ